jgi:hypothetical protein
VDGIYDIHYVDDAGKEIPPEQALRKSGDSQVEEQIGTRVIRFLVGTP